ncbi:MAG: class I SAM-dependent methyltransferase [Proteobacteria bacterium]|nr:class I SAM-dependent methyltransferase [Pseudomonadota bacterium]MDA0952780.1 class I SAM-dependent methyltransferase [Pseudomonadota bacterium]
MPIIKARSHRDVYRLRAESGDIHELSGRGADRATTELVTREIAGHLGLDAASRADLLDIGCGDGSMVVMLAPLVRRAVGIAPSHEEIKRLRSHHKGVAVEFLEGLAEDLPLPDASFDRIIMHGVVTILPSTEIVVRALAEVKRIARPGGLIWIGSLPDRDEAAFYGRTYGDSITGWLWFVLRRQGLRAAWRATRRVLSALVSSEPLVIQPKELYVCPPECFRAMAEEQGLEVLWQGRVRTLAPTGQAAESETRFNFLLRRPD